MLPDPWNADVDTLWCAVTTAWGRPTAENEVLLWLRRRTPAEWARIDHVLRGWSWQGYMPPEELRSPLAWGWRCLHHDGHVREAAVRALADDPRNHADGFLILRCADWVEPVRALARAAVARRGVELATWLPLLLARSGATELPGACLAAAPPGTLVSLVRHPVAAARRWAFARWTDASAPELRALLADTTDGVVAAHVATRLAAEADDVQLAALLRHPHSVVRRAGWAHVVQGRLPELDLRPGLLDRAVQVRALAQVTARRRGVDAAAIYRATPGRRGLVGLGEVGAPDAVPAAVAALADPVESVRVAAIGLLAARSEGALLLGRLEQARDAELRALRRGLLRTGTRVDDTTLARLRAGTPDQRWEAWRLGSAPGRWARVRADLHAVQDADPRLATAARADLSTWCVQAGPEAGVPPPDLAALLPPPEPAAWWRYLAFVFGAR